MPAIRMALLGALAAALLAGCATREEPPSLVLVVVDTLRADALGCYGSPRARTPFLDALAARGLQFRTCLSQAPWTLPATATILTGRYPSDHGANRLLRPVAPDVPLLAERLAGRGYATGAIVANPFLARRYGLHRGFAHYDETLTGPEDAVTSAAITEAARAWLQRAPRGPFFLFLFYMDPHYAYVSHEGFTPPSDYDGPVRSGQDIWELRRVAPELGERDFDRLAELYAGEVAYLDRAIGGLVRALEAAGRLENTVLVVTADHGEELGEHGWIGHTRNLYADLLEVPLLLSGPIAEARRVRADAAMLVDVAPTLARLAGLLRGTGPGRDLLGADRGPRALYAEVTYDPRAIPPQRDPRRAGRRALELTKLADQRSLERGGWKAIHDRARGTWELYDRSRDPAEACDLASERPDLVSRLAGEFPEPGPFDAQPGAPSEGISPAERERLRALGYVR